MVAGFGSTPLVLSPLLNIFPYLCGGPESSNRMSDSHILTFRQPRGWNRDFLHIECGGSADAAGTTLHRLLWHFKRLDSKTVTFRPSFPIRHFSFDYRSQLHHKEAYACDSKFRVHSLAQGPFDSRRQQESNRWCQNQRMGPLPLLSRHFGEDGAKPKSEG